MKKNQKNSRKSWKKFQRQRTRGKFSEQQKSITKEKKKYKIMSRAFYIPPQTQSSYNPVGNAELMDILVATLLSLLDRRHRCTRRCCSRIAYHGPNYVSCEMKLVTNEVLNIYWNVFLFKIVEQQRPSITSLD